MNIDNETDKRKLLLKMWKEDSKIDTLHIGNALTDIPKLHSKYLDIQSNHRIASKNIEFDLHKIKKEKWEYYTGKLDEQTLEEKGWEPFQLNILKTDLHLYLDSDKDIIDILKKKQLHDEIIDICNQIIKELNSRTYQLRAYIDNEKFINGG